MSPYEIGIMLHYYASACDYPDMKAPIWHETVTRFVDNGLLKRSSREEMFSEITALGTVYCRALMAVQIPPQPRTEAYTGWPRAGVDHLGVVCADPACKYCVAINEMRK